MTGKMPHTHDSEDAHSDDLKPTDAVTDEVKADAADSAHSGSAAHLPDAPAITHP